MEKEKKFYMNPHERIITHVKIVSTKKQKDSNFLNSEYTLYTFKYTLYTLSRKNLKKEPLKLIIPANLVQASCNIRTMVPVLSGQPF